MNYLDTILNEQNLDSELESTVRKFSAVVAEKLKEADIVFSDEDAELVFCNHIVALIKRCVSKEFVADIEEEMMEEVSKEAFEIAQSLLKDVFVQNGCTVNRSEVFLVATHIQMYLDSKNN